MRFLTPSTWATGRLWALVGLCTLTAFSAHAADTTPAQQQARWTAEAEAAFARMPVACFIAVQDARILGFACHDATHRNFFGPEGVLESARGRGLGDVHAGAGLAGSNTGVYLGVSNNDYGRLNILKDQSLNGPVDPASDLDKFVSLGIDTRPGPVLGMPLIEQDCIAWLECRRIPEPHTEQAYDTCFAEVVAAAADPRAFADGRWVVRDGKPGLPTLHHLGAGLFAHTSGTLQARRRI